MSNFAFPEPYQDLSAEEMNLNREITKKGWMLKKAGKSKFPFTQLSNYDRRYFFLIKGWVYYYKDQSSTKPQGKFSLQGYSNRVAFAEEEACTSLPYVFKLYSKAASGRTWYLAPETESLMHQWKECFKAQIDKYNVAASNLRMSRSLPEKWDHEASPHGQHLAVPVSISLRDDVRKNRMNNKGSSLSSSHSASTSGSEMSLPNYDRTQELEESDNFYEPLTNNDNYLSPDEIHTPKPMPPPRPGNKPFSPTRAHPLDSTMDVYQEIKDDDLSRLEVRDIFPHFPKISEKEQINRKHSFPTEKPPRPPSKNISSPLSHEIYEEPSGITTIGQVDMMDKFRDKPLPPTPSLEISQPPVISRNKPLPNPRDLQEAYIDPNVGCDTYQDSADIVEPVTSVRPKLDRPFSPKPLSKPTFFAKPLPPTTPSNATCRDRNDSNAVQDNATLRKCAQSDAGDKPLSPSTKPKTYAKPRMPLTTNVGRPISAYTKHPKPSDKPMVPLGKPKVPLGKPIGSTEKPQVPIAKPISPSKQPPSPLEKPKTLSKPNKNSKIMFSGQPEKSEESGDKMSILARARMFDVGSTSSDYRPNYKPPAGVNKWGNR